MSSDEQLVASVMQGDRNAFGQLVQRYQTAVWATATHVLGDHHEAQDVAQEAFLRSYQKLPTLRRHSAFKGWLLKTTRRIALNTRRQRERSRVVHTARGLDTSEDNHMLTEQSAAVLAAVMALPAKERAVVMLHHFDQVKVRTIAERTGRPVGTVTKQLSRAYRRLAKLLSEQERC